MDDGEVPDDEEEGEDLCNCQFSLAYGAKILLNTAPLSSPVFVVKTVLESPPSCVPSPMGQWHFQMIW